ncbi:MAG: PorP/SprF family type IX secretion system membrane protein [Bacteroidetes bacterium]|nr:PorP/SprF family type IX secretion system membrane protein [Bacteroidota bacterium]
MFILPFSLFAQDVHFSMSEFSPIIQNPGSTGDFRGDWRVANIHRRQWSTLGVPWLTTSIGYDHQFYMKKDRFSAGAVIMNDKSGTGELTANAFVLSGAYHKKINSEHFSMGINLSYFNKSLTWKSLSFGDQWNDAAGYFDNNLPTGETFAKDATHFFNFDWGATWHHKWEKFSAGAGFAQYHLNKPKESFFQSENRLRIRNHFQIWALYPLSEKIDLIPETHYSFDIKASEVVTGCKAWFRLPENNYRLDEISAGVLIRNGIRRNFDAIIITTGFRTRGWTIGLAYDVNVSGLSVATNSFGAIEIGLIYTGISTWLEKFTVPCDRY